MMPDRLDQCLSVIRWTPETLAQCLGCDVSMVHAWLAGKAEIPMNVAVWIEMMAEHHVAFEETKPKGLTGRRFP